MKKIIATLRFWYLLTVVLSFVFAIGVKVSADYPSNLLSQYDPFLTLLTSRQLLVAAVLAELFLIIFILWNIRRAPMRGVVATIWVGCLFLAYRIGFDLSPSDSQIGCKCLGGVGGILGKNSESVASIMLGYILIMGAVVLVAEMLSRKKRFWLEGPARA